MFYAEDGFFGVMHSLIEKLNPAVDKRLLIALSGIMWAVVGIILCKTAVGWFLQIRYAFLFGISGVILSLLIHYLGFSSLVKQNIERILSKKEKTCIFGFQAWKSYLIIILMVSIGMVMRNSPLPKSYLAIIYAGFGGAMCLSSLRYLRAFLKTILL